MPIESVAGRRLKFIGARWAERRSVGGQSGILVLAWRGGDRGYGPAGNSFGLGPAAIHTRGDFSLDPPRATGAHHGPLLGLPRRWRSVSHVPCRSSGGTLGRNNHLTDWPEREPSKLQMRPGEGDTDNGYGEQDRSDYVREREPPAG